MGIYISRLRRGVKDDANGIDDWVEYEAQPGHLKPLDGEIVLVDDNGIPRLKIGDGVHEFSELPYMSIDSFILPKHEYISLLPNEWNTDDGGRHWQEVKINGATITSKSKIDLQPTPEQLSIFKQKDLTFVAENTGGVVKVYCVGQIPQNKYEIPVTVTEVVAPDGAVIIGNTTATPNPHIFTEEEIIDLILENSTNIEVDGIPKDIQIYTVDDVEKLILIDKNNNPIGEGTQLPATGAMGLGVENVDDDGVEKIKLWLKDENGQMIDNSAITFAGGTGNSTTTTITIERITPNEKTINYTEKASIEFNFSSTDKTGEQYNGYYTLRTGSTVLETGRLRQGYNNFDVTKYVTINTTTEFTFDIRDETGNTLKRTWNIEVVKIELRTEFSEFKVESVDNDIAFDYSVTGSVDKIVHFKLDGIEIGTHEVSGSRSQQFIIPRQVHGAHFFEVYVTAKISGQDDIRTDSIYRDIIWCDENSKTPIISCIYRKEYYGSIELKQLYTKTFPFYVIDPSTNTPTIMKEVDGVLVATEILSSESPRWPFKTSDIGKHTLVISCGDTCVEIEVNITDIGFEVDPVDGYVFDFNPSGLSNNNVDRLWKEKNNSDITMTVSDNFDWQNGGYQIDENGNEYFCIKSGTQAYISYQLFAKDARKNGAAFKVIFKTTNVSRADSTFLSCETDSGTTQVVGLKMNVHEAYITTGGSPLYIPYSEEDIIEFEYNINKIDTSNNDATSYIMSYEDGTALRPLIYDNTHQLYQYEPEYITIGSNDCDVHIYRMRAYEKSLQDTDIISNFIIDARNSDEMISRHDRNDIYTKGGAFTPQELAKKCPDLKIIMIDCPHFTSGKDEFVADTTITCIHEGGDEVDNWTAKNCYHSGQGTTSNTYGYSGRNIDILMCLDGTYTHKKINGGVADPSYITELTLGDGTVYGDGRGKITLTRNSVPNNYFTIKVNIASSENANNALLAKRFNDYLPYKTPAQKRNPNVKNSMEFVNCVVFVRENSENISEHREFDDRDWHFYAIGNIGDSKNTDATRVNDADDPNEFVLEISDNTLPNAIFQTGYYTDKGKIQYPITKEQWSNSTAKDKLYNNFYKDDDGSYEFRYISESANETDKQNNEQVWRNFYEWVITSSDDEFREQLGDWFIEQSAFYFYLFTERYTMMDNRAKNTFWHYGKVYITDEEAIEMGEDAANYTIDNGKAAHNNGYRFEFWDYDNDTSLGINNSGVLGFPYGKEDIDYQRDGDASSGYVFNGAESVFFCRIRDLMRAKLQDTYQRCETAQAWSADGLIKEFEDWQNQFPEELWRLDAERKYYRPYYGTTFPEVQQDKNYLRDRMNGRKKYHRRQWERDQEAYMGSKYISAKSLAEAMTIRCVGNTNDDKGEFTANYTLKITPYSDMYVTVMYGNTTPKQIRAKAGEITTFTTDLEMMDDTQIIIYNGRRIQALDDLSLCYIREGLFSQGVRLKKLVIGSGKSGYKNTVLNSLEIDNNPILEVLDIRNCNALEMSLPLASCVNLRELYADGTNISGVTFANQGKIERVHLPDGITKLELKNLQCIKHFQMSYKQLTEVIIENSNINEKLILNQSIDNLKKLRLVGIDWTGDESLMNVLLLTKIDAIKESELSGKVEIKRGIKQSDLDHFNSKWPDLAISYTHIFELKDVQYCNYDGTHLYTYQCYEDDHPIDPVLLGYEVAPTKPDTESHYYTFWSWDKLYDLVGSDGAILTAVFTKHIKTYTVTWYDLGGLIHHTTTVEHGSEAVPDPTKHFATRYYDSSKKEYRVFTGWDKSTGSVKCDMDVNPTYDSATWTNPKYVDITSMSPAQIYALAQHVAEFKPGTSTGTDPASLLYSRDYYDITMGNDFNFENVASEEIVSVSKPWISSDNTPSEPKTLSTNEEIKLFVDDEGNERSFTIAIDFRFTNTTNNNTLLSICEADGNKGFKLKYDQNNGYPVIEWGGQTYKVGNGMYRDIVVIRYIKGDNTLHIYTGCPETSGKFADEVTIQHKTSAIDYLTGMPITFGAVKNGDNTYTNKGYGVIYWCKVWYDDLGEINAKELATWCRETLRMEYYTARSYLLQGESDKYAGLSFVANNCLSQYGYPMRDENGIKQLWGDTAMRNFCNGRLYNGLPIAWRSMIASVKVYSVAEGVMNTRVTSNDRIYLLSAVETQNRMTDDYYYKLEITDYNHPLQHCVSWLNSTGKRIKFRGVIRENISSSINSSDEDPTLDSTKDVKTGYIWLDTSTNSSSDTYYIFIDNNQYKTLMPASSGICKRAKNEKGYWISSNQWWIRSADWYGNKFHHYIRADGVLDETITTTSNYSICPCFSI